MYGINRVDQEPNMPICCKPYPYFLGYTAFLYNGKFPLDMSYV